MKHNQYMLEKHASDWGEKVRIVGISVDDEKDSVIKRINEKNWKLVDHFFLGGWNEEHNAVKNYQFNGIPHIVLVDQQGIVVHVGSPNVNLENLINDLLKTEPLEKQEKKSLKELNNLLSKQVVELLNKPEFESVKYNLSINWKKNISYSETGDLDKFSYQKPNLTLSYNIKNEAKVKEVEESLFKLIPKDLFEEVSYTIEDPKGAFNFCLNALKLELQASNLQEAEIHFKKSQSFEWDGKMMVNGKSKVFSHENTIKPTKIDQVENFTKNLIKTLDANDPLLTYLLKRFQLSCKLSKGDEFLPLELQEVFSDEKVLLKHENDEVLLVDFWATWCGPCQGPMAHNQKMLEQNLEKWGNKVRIVGISLDQSKASVVNKVNDKNWKKIVHYFLGDNKKGSNAYGVKGIPEVVLINQKGIIVYKGHPARTNLEEEINRLLEGKNDEEIEVKKEDKTNEIVLQPVSKVDVKKLSLLLKSSKFNSDLKKAGEEMKYKANFTVEWNNKIIFDNEMKIREERIENPIISLGLRISDLPKFSPILSSIYETIDAVKLREKKELINSISIKFGLSCEACKKEMKPFDPQYYCHFCKQWFCAECGDKVDETKTGNDRLVHPHNMLWINITDEEGLQDVDEYKIGKNIVFKENCQVYGASCNGCSGAVDGGYRYICVSCRPGPSRPGGFVDLCHKCINQLKEKNNKEVEEIEKGLAEEEHNGKSHLWLRICYGNNYYNY